MKDFNLKHPFAYDAVVLANGEQPTHQIALKLLKEAPYIVCCDGAIQRYNYADAIVGDGDSISSWARKKYEEIFEQVDEQDDNDLTKATRHCMTKGFRRIVYLGATGLREDHTLGNISLLIRYAKEFDIEPIMVTNYGWFVPVCKEQTEDIFHKEAISKSEMAFLPKENDKEKNSNCYTREFISEPNQQVSIFNFGCTQLYTEGLRYDGYPFTSWWQGTLNEATADHFNIVADGDYLVFRTF